MLGISGETGQQGLGDKNVEVSEKEAGMSEVREREMDDGKKIKRVREEKRGVERTKQKNNGCQGITLTRK